MLNKKSNRLPKAKVPETGASLFLLSISDRLENERLAKRVGPMFGLHNQLKDLEPTPNVTKDEPDKTQQSSRYKITSPKSGRSRVAKRWRTTTDKSLRFYNVHKRHGEAREEFLRLQNAKPLQINHFDSWRIYQTRKKGLVIASKGQIVPVESEMDAAAKIFELTVARVKNILSLREDWKVNGPETLDL